MKKFSVFLALIFLVLVAFPSEKVLALGPDEKIQALKNAGIIKGYPDGSLGLERPITRAEIAVILTKLKAQDLESSAKVVFKDLGADHWALDYVNKACQIKNPNGVLALAGYPDGSFEPGKNISYAEILKILVAATKADLTSADVENSLWPESWLIWAKEMEIFGNKSGVTINDPNQAASRRDVFLMTYNALGDSLSPSNNQGQAANKLKGQTKDQRLKAFNSGQSYDTNLFQEEFLALINADRRKLGLNDLSWASNLDQGAEIRSKELADFGSVVVNGKSHVRLDGRSWETVLDYLQEASFARSLGENLAELKITTTSRDLTDKSKRLMTDEKYLAKSFYDLWWNSPGHKANMMHPNFSQISVQIQASDHSITSAAYKNIVIFTGTTIFIGY